MNEPKTQGQEENSKHQLTEKRKNREYYINMGLSCGIGLGVACGHLIFDSLAAGIAVGGGIGLVVSICLYLYKKKKNNENII